MNQALILGKNIKKYRKSKRMTQEELAEKLFVTSQNISKWENGRCMPDVSHLCLLADVLDVTVDKLLSRSSCDGRGKLMIGIDGGGSKTEFCLFAEDGTIIRKKTLGGTNPNVYDIPTVSNVLRTGIDILLDTAPDVSAIFAGIAGCSYTKNADKITDFLKNQYPDIQIGVTGDSVNSVYSTDFYDSCVVVIAGTGSVIFVKNNDKMTRIGGWGYLFDKGYNGYYLGTEVIRAVMAHEDGIGRPTTLTKRLQNQLNGRAIDSINALYSKSNKEMASFVQMLFEAYDEQDEVACDIIEDNIKILQRMLDKAIENHSDCDKKVVITGGLTKRKDILLRFLQSRDGVEFIFPDLPPIYGACHCCARKFANPPDDFYNTFKKNYKEIKSNDKN